MNITCQECGQTMPSNQKHDLGDCVKYLKKTVEGARAGAAYWEKQVKEWRSKAEANLRLAAERVERIEVLRGELEEARYELKASKQDLRETTDELHRLKKYLSQVEVSDD